MRGRGAAAVVGAVTLALLSAWLLLGGGPEGPAPEESPPPKRMPVAHAPAPRDEPAQRPSGPASPLAPSTAQKPPPGEFSLDVLAALDDGTPVKGVTFLGMVRGEDGDPQVSLEPDALFKEETDVEGKCTLKWKERPEEILLLVLCKTAEVVAVEGGALLGPETSGEVVAAESGPGSLRLAMRTRGGVGSLFLLDARTGEPITKRNWLWRIRFPDGSLLPGSGGGLGEQATRFPLELPALPRRDLHAPDERVLEFAVQGYETAEVRLAEFRGANPLRLEPKVPSVVGEIVVPGMRDDLGWIGLALNASLAKEDPSPPEEGKAPPLAWPVLAPSRPGPFALYDLAEGRWELRLMAFTREGPRFARRTFEVGPGSVDLGTVEVSGWSGLRVRLLDVEGRPVNAARFSLLPIERAPMAVVGSTVRIVRQDGSVFADFGPASVAKEAPPDPDGWFLFPALAPGARYRVTATSHPGASAEITTPETNGAVADVELRLPKDAKRTEGQDGGGDLELPAGEK